MSSLASPTFTTLPVEIRKEILHWAFIAVCSQPSSLDPDGLSLTPTINFHPSTISYGQWGHEPMTRILRLNHQLYDEAIDVLYKNRFVFLTPFNIRRSEGSIGFFKTLGKRVENIQSITVEMNISAEVDSPSWKFHRHENWQNLSFLWNKLKGVRSVRFIPTFTRAWGFKFHGSEFSKFVTLKDGDSEILEERVMEFVNFFQREWAVPIHVQIDPASTQRVGGSVDIIKACRKRPIGGPSNPPETGWSWVGFGPTA